MKINFQKVERALFSSSSRYIEATIFFISASYVVSTHRMLPYFTQSAHFCVAHKQTNPWMDRQSDYSTPCAQAHGVKI